MYINWTSTTSIAYINNSKEIDDRVELINMEINKMQTAVKNYTPYTTIIKTSIRNTPYTTSYVIEEKENPQGGI